jgi:hypothetical protein
VEQCTRGEIFFDINFRYDPKSPACEKLLLVLNKNHNAGGDVVWVPATTHKGRYPYKNGCNQKERVFYFEKKVGYYDDKTLIQFDFVERITTRELEDRIRLKDVQKQQGKKVSETEVNLILACLKSIKYDIPEEVTELVF